MALVASTLLDLLKNLRAFAGILVVSDFSILQLTSWFLILIWAWSSSRKNTKYKLFIICSCIFKWSQPTNVGVKTLYPLFWSLSCSQLMTCSFINWIIVYGTEFLFQTLDSVTVWPSCLNSPNTYTIFSSWQWRAEQFTCKGSTFLMESGWCRLHAFCRWCTMCMLCLGSGCLREPLNLLQR